MKILKVLISIGILFFLTMAFNMYRFNYNLDNGFWRTLMSPFEGTIWASNFSETAFSKAKIGMSSKAVKSLLGNPISKRCDSKKNCFWNYTWQETGTADFDQRWIVFNRSNRVVEIRKGFFID